MASEELSTQSMRRSPPANSDDRSRLHRFVSRELAHEISKDMYQAPM